MALRPPTNTHSGDNTILETHCVVAPTAKVSESNPHRACACDCNRCANCSGTCGKTPSGTTCQMFHFGQRTSRALHCYDGLLVSGVRPLHVPLPDWNRCAKHSRSRHRTWHVNNTCQVHDAPVEPTTHTQTINTIHFQGWLLTIMQLICHGVLTTSRLTHDDFVVHGAPQPDHPPTCQSTTNLLRVLHLTNIPTPLPYHKQL
jgi:hypothetical protein